MDIEETLQTGNRSYQNGLTLDYRDWPASIKDVDTGTIVYPAPLTGAAFSKSKLRSRI